MADELIDVSPDWARRAYVDDAKYKAMYEVSIKDPARFWGEHGKRVDWIKPFTKVKNTSYDPHNVSIKWFEDGTLNACFNCVDRHVDAGRGNQVAIHRLTVPEHNPTQRPTAARSRPPERRAESAGVQAAAEINPVVIPLLQEVGLELGSKTPRTATPQLIQRASRVVTFGCLDRCPIGAKEKAEDWPIPGATEKSMEELRAIRDELRHRVADLASRLVAR